MQIRTLLYVAIVVYGYREVAFVMCQCRLDISCFKEEVRTNVTLIENGNMLCQERA